MKTSTESKRIFGSLVVLSLLFTSCRHLRPSPWPSITEVSVRHHFAANKESERLKAIIYDRAGKPLYCLDARFCWRDYEVEDYNFSGTLDCRLFPMNGETSCVTLLQNTAHATRDWQTYGRFLHEELVGFAGADPSRAMVQRCGVRGMVIEIQVFNVKEQKDKKGIATFDMIFTAKNCSPKERLYANGAVAAQDY